MNTVLYHRLKPTALEFASSVSLGKAREIACFGARGDGKTWGALWAMILHAAEHAKQGYKLPTVWLGVRDTFSNHKLSTIQTLTEPSWEGRWRIEDDGHLATFHVEHADMVQLRLVGVDSPADIEKVRTQCHGVWVDEAAPAATLSQGVSADVWSFAMSSQRLPTHARVAMLTSNYSDEEHWSALRFVFDPHPGTLCFRIPPGERASTAYREELSQAYATRPDLARRLLEGKFGTVLAGQPVAAGFDLDFHVARGRRLVPDRERPLWIGQDGGHTPTSVICQRVGEEIRVLAGLASEHDGIHGHVETVLLPWLGEHAPWALELRPGSRDMLQVRYDPSIDVDEQANIDSNGLRVMRRLLPATYLRGPTSWEGRRDPLMTALNTRRPALVIDASCNQLIRALSSQWIYAMRMSDGGLRRDIPKKPNHPWEDLGDALCYALSGMSARATVGAFAPRQRSAWSGLMPRLGPVPNAERRPDRPWMPQALTRWWT